VRLVTVSACSDRNISIDNLNFTSGLILLSTDPVKAICCLHERIIMLLHSLVELVLATFSSDFCKGIINTVLLPGGPILEISRKGLFTLKIVVIHADTTCGNGVEGPSGR